MARGRSLRPERSSTGPDRHATARSRHGVHVGAIGIARFLADALTPTPGARRRLASARLASAAASRPPRPGRSARRAIQRRQLVLRLTSDRTLPIAVALVVLVAAGLSLAPAAAPVG